MVKDFTAEEIIQYISEAEKVTPLKMLNSQSHLKYLVLKHLKQFSVMLKIGRAFMKRINQLLQI
jgi:hypothetical protein